MAAGATAISGDLPDYSGYTGIPGESDTTTTSTMPYSYDSSITSTSLETDVSAASYSSAIGANNGLMAGTSIENTSSTSGSAFVQPTTSPIQIDLPKSGGLSAGASAGIGVGVALGVLVLVLIAFIAYRRRRKHQQADNDIPVISELGSQGPKLESLSGGSRLESLGVDDNNVRVVPELGSDGQKIELSAGGSRRGRSGVFKYKGHNDDVPELE
ncbi:hypothetical protein N7466_011425 [Penicillium verhagenii]|uniref:uncharacterized protein n=1 Tax=Penicillium verhagenii TaxID=1562060 RepID=UPI0025455429|nr:uncharacterized protein N7466_011425 [Penicillium verhagenii]KAJ5915492.1 hypothetical protein N7466_011425 [Penicillium verhagenii]